MQQSVNVDFELDNFDLQQHWVGIAFLIMATLLIILFFWRLPPRKKNKK